MAPLLPFFKKADLAVRSQMVFLAGSLEKLQKTVQQYSSELDREFGVFYSDTSEKAKVYANSIRRNATDCLSIIRGKCQEAIKPFKYSNFSAFSSAVAANAVLVRRAIVGWLRNLHLR